MIRITGFSMERFMNLAAYRRILFWDAKGVGGGMEMKTSLAGLKELEECAQKTGCHLEILALGGLPEKMRHAKTHPIFAVGILFFAAALYVLSSFVWVVHVEGNERLTEEEILTACEAYGLKPGKWKKQVDADAVTKALLADISDLSWVSVSIKGAEATVKVAETIVAPTPMEEETPCDMKKMAWWSGSQQPKERPLCRREMWYRLGMCSFPRKCRWDWKGSPWKRNM